MKSKKHSEWVLVTGAGGFVGGHCVSALLAAGFRVLALQRKHKSIPNLPDSDTDWFRRIIADLNDDIALTQKVGAIVHLAAQVVYPDVTATQFASHNISTTISAFSLARKLNAKLVVFHSSTSIYGNASEPAINEETPSISPAPYGASKYIGELIAREEALERRIVAPRTPGIIGPGANPNFLADLLEKASKNKPIALRNPEARFNHVIHVDDYCRFIVALLKQENHSPGFDAVNLAAREPITIATIVHLIVERLGSSSQIETVESDGSVPTINVEKAANAYNFSPLTVEKTIMRYCDQRTE